MATYLILYTFTEQGAKAIKGTVQRAAQVRQREEQRGVAILGLYWLQGPYDLAVLVEADDVAQVMAGVLSIVAAGNVRSQTLRAFSASSSWAAFARRAANIWGNSASTGFFHCATCTG